VGDRLIERPPWQAGRGFAPSGSVAVLPIAYQPGASLPPNFDPPDGRGSAVRALLDDMNHYLADLGTIPVLPRTPRSAGRPPDVSFGCELDSTDECAPWQIGRPVHRLAAGRPSSAWAAWADNAMAEAAVDAVLVITLEVGQYLPRQRDLLGRKSVELGRDHWVSLPWLTSLETPVSVLQLTGALVDRNGRAIRIAAEGILARRTSLPASSVGLQALLTDEEVEQARTVRRDDLPRRPLVWKAALDYLMEALLGGSGAPPRTRAP
jgi:hypothetical protein